MHVYFEPFVKEMSDLNVNGFNWTNPTDKRVVHTKVKVLVGVCDTVARPLLQNYKQFNGKHGCGYNCLDVQEFWLLRAMVRHEPIHMKYIRNQRPRKPQMFWLKELQRQTQKS